VTGSLSTLGLIVVTYSPGPPLDRLLDSLPSAFSRPVPVVLADNGSTDGSVQRAAARPGVRVVETGGNLGYGRAANAGVQAVESGGEAPEFVLICNPDIVFGADSLDALLAAADRWPQAAAFGPLIKTPDGRIYPSARDLPSIGRGIGHALCGWWWPSNPWTRAYRRQDERAAERVAGWLSGACLMVRRTAFDDIGGFDPRYFMYFEDVDLGDRLGRAGWQNVLVPTATVVHTGGHATERTPALMAAEHHRSAYRYLADRYSRWWQAPLRAALRAGLAARAALARRSAAVSAGAALPDERR